MIVHSARFGRATPRARRTRLTLAVVVALALLAGACGDDSNDSSGDSSGATTPSTTAAATSTTLAPQTGGSLTVGLFAATQGFDPANVTVAGSTNGMELAAIYGTLVRYNAQTATYEPLMASALEKSADFTTWTIRLRPGVKFTDGTAFDAAAVKLNIERHMATTARSSAKPALLQFVDSITAADANTVVIKLKQAWAGFPYMLTVGPGMILSPAAIAKAGANLNSAPGDAGAGPFKISSFNAGEALVLKKNPDYFGGPVYLDELRFVQVGAPDQSYIALKNNTIQAAYLRDPVALANAKKDGFPSVLYPSPGGNIALLNSGVEVTCAGGQPASSCAGKADGTKVITTPPTSDVKVRQAVSYAIDRDGLNQRVWSGTAVVGAQLLDKSSQYYADVKFPDYNLTEAKRLVQEAKAAGWNGAIRVLTDSSNSAWGIAVKTMLESAGMTVNLDTSKALSAIIPQVSGNKDFEVVSWGSGMDTSDADYFFASGNFSSTGRYGLRSAAFDAALDKLRLASTIDQKKDAYKILSEAWAKDMPAVPIATVYSGLAHSKNLHDVILSSSIVFFEKAWIAK
jgi:peptide/nickel transport system substrate-binding protein